jgi:hypothetical protein
MAKRTRGILLIVSLALLWAPVLRAEEKVGQIGRDVVIAAGETAGDIGCVFCSVHVHGDVNGNVGVTFGDLELDPGHQISGNVGVMGGRVLLGDGSRVGGNMGIVGWLREGDGVTVGGSRGVLPGEILLVPFLLLAGAIWLVVYLVRRNRYRPVYPPGYPGQRL